MGVSLGMIPGEGTDHMLVFGSVAVNMGFVS